MIGFGTHCVVVFCALLGSFLVINSQINSRVDGQSNLQTSNYRITGIVLDENGNPLEGARVFARVSDKPGRARTPIAFSGADGRFSIENVEPGDNAVWAEKESDGYPAAFSIAFNGKAAHVTISENQPTADVVTQTGPKCPRLVGKVVEKDNPSFAVKDAGVKLSLVGQQGWILTGVKEDGTFDFLVPADQPFTVEFTSKTHKQKKLTQNDNGVQTPHLVFKRGEKREVTVKLDKQ